MFSTHFIFSFPVAIREHCHYLKVNVAEFKSL